MVSNSRETLKFAIVGLFDQKLVKEPYSFKFIFYY